jgi:hypothetical protein
MAVSRSTTRLAADLLDWKMRDTFAAKLYDELGNASILHFFKK